MFMAAALVAEAEEGVTALTGGALAIALGCGASVVEVAFGLLTGVAEAVAGGFFSFCSVRDLSDLDFFSFALLFAEEDSRGAMLFPFSDEGETAACDAVAACAAQRKTVSAVVYRTFFILHS